MAKPVNLIRNTPAKLVAKEVNFLGKRWAVQDRADGYSLINVTVQPAPTEIKSYLEGNPNLLKYPVASNITKLCKHALASFPALKELYLFSTTKVIIESEGIDAISGDNIYLGDLLDLEHIYVPTALISEYEASYPYLTGKFVSIYDGDTFVIEHFEGQDVLTVQMVIDQFNVRDTTKVFTKVKVPVEFTSYESGSIAKIEELFTDMEHLITCYDAGEMDIEIGGDIEQKIISINKTLDEALVYARTIPIIQNSVSLDGSKAIIIPPMITNRQYKNQFVSQLGNNLVYIDDVKFTGNTVCDSLIPISSNIVKVKKISFTNRFGGAGYITLASEDYLKSVKMLFNNGVVSNGTLLLQNCLSLEELILEKSDRPIIFRGDFVKLTQSGLHNLIESLATVSSKTSISFQNSNVNQRIALNDIQLAYDKNWALYPTPSAFTFTIGGNTYSCDFGMTWEQWCASAYNTDGYSQFAGYVVDSNRNYIKLNGESVSTNSMIRYGDTFDYQAYFGSFEYQGTLPTTPNMFSAKYYSDSACTNEVLVANLVIGTTYYYTLVFDYGTNFATDTWEQIKCAYDNGVAQYSLGDTKTITYNNETYTIRICDIGARYDLADGSGKNKAVFEFVELLTTGYKMNTSNTNSGGWASSNIKTNVMPTIYSNLPNDLKQVISQVSVASASDGSASGSGSLSYSDNYLFLPSAYELFGVRANSNEIEQTSQYQLYAANNTSDFRKKHKVNVVSTTYWWERSPVAGNIYFCCVGTGGGYDLGGANDSLGVAPFFAI